MRGLTEEAAAVAIDVATRVLHLPTVRASADEGRVPRVGVTAELADQRVGHRVILASLE